MLSALLESAFSGVFCLQCSSSHARGHVLFVILSIVYLVIHLLVLLAGSGFRKHLALHSIPCAAYLESEVFLQLVVCSAISGKAAPGYQLVLGIRTTSCCLHRHARSLHHRLYSPAMVENLDV